MERQIRSVALDLGVDPAAVEAGMLRSPARTRVVAGLLGLPADRVQARVLELGLEGMSPDAALDCLVLTATR